MTVKELDVRDQKLFALMQQIDFGRLEHLDLQNGFAVSTAQSRKVSSRKLGKESAPHRNSRIDGNFILTDKHISFLENIKTAGSGHIVVIQIQNGLPVSMELAEGIDII